MKKYYKLDLYVNKYNIKMNKIHLWLNNSRKILSMKTIPHIKELWYETNCCYEKYDRVLLFYRLHSIKINSIKNIEDCIHLEPKLRIYKEKRILCSLKFEKKYKKDILRSVNITIEYDIHKLKNICSNYIAELIHNTILYSLKETEMKPIKTIFLRNIEHSINRDIFKMIKERIMQRLNEHMIK